VSYNAVSGSVTQFVCDTLMPMKYSLVIFALLAACSAEQTPVTDDAELTAMMLTHTKVLTIDSHIDIPLNFATHEVDPGIKGPDQVDLVKMEEGGLDAGFFIVYVGQGPRTEAGYAQAREEAMTKFSAIHRMAEAMYPERIAIAYHPVDVARINATGKLVALIGIENGYVIGNNPDLIKTYYELGGRYLTLTHNGHNDLADSAQPRGEPVAEHGGLSPLGLQVIEEMNRVGMLVDISHISRDAALQAIAHSSQPVIASHSSVKAVHDHPRNLDDATMLALAAKGGVMQIVAFDAYLHPVPAAKNQAISRLLSNLGVASPGVVRSLPAEKFAAYEQGMRAIHKRWPQANLQDLGEHIDYAVKLMGIDHVGISSDFGGGGGIDGWNNAAETANVTGELLRRGYTGEELGKLWGGNLLRVMSIAEQGQAQ
jgi:membrane dipeptidase